MIASRKMRNGYTDFGGIQIPPRAQAFVLTDRDTGTKYLVSYNTDSFGVTRLSLNTDYANIQRVDGVQSYEAYDGPKIDTDGQYTVIVRSGRIGYDYTAYPRAITDMDQAPPYSRTTSSQKQVIIRETLPNPLLARIGIKD